MSASKPIRLGVIGLSRSSTWTPVLLWPIFPPAGPLASKYTITALCTTNETSARAASAHFSALYDASSKHTITPYWGPGGARQLAQDANVDMVAVVVSVGGHKDAVWPALEAGKDVFVEWPLGKGLKETEEIAKLAREKGCKIRAVGAQGVQSNVVKRMREAVRKGKVGRVVSTTVIGNCDQELGYWGPLVGEKATWLGDADCGATFLDVAVGHFLAGFTFVLGDVASLQATMATQFPEYQIVSGRDAAPTSSKRHTRTSEDQILVSGTLKSGATFSFHFRSGLAGAAGGRRPFLWLIDGEAGTITVDDDNAPGASFMHIRNPKLFVKGEEVVFKKEEVVDYTGPVKGEWEEIAKGEKGTFSTFEDAVRIHRVIDAIRTSAREGRRISLE